MRAFVAVNPPERFRRELDTRLDTWRDRFRIAWTRPRAWHLTLVFLGEWPAERLDALADALDTVLAGRAPLPLQPRGLGAFPNLRRPRVLFLHLDGGDALRSLAADVRRAVDTVWPDGPQDHKEFRPHLTLARVKTPLPPPVARALGQIDLGPWDAFPVDRVAVMTSELRPEGARHAVRRDLPLGGA